MLESTAAGRHDWWHRKWLYNIANWSTGRSRLRPNFLPWFVGTDIWPPDTWVHAHPIPLDWRPFDSTIAHAERAAEYVRDTPLLTKYLGSGWVMPRRQMWFYEIERAEAVANKSLNKFLGEIRPAHSRPSSLPTSLPSTTTPWNSTARTPGVQSASMESSATRERSTPHSGFAARYRFKQAAYPDHCGVESESASDPLRARPASHARVWFANGFLEQASDLGEARGRQ